MNQPPPSPIEDHLLPREKEIDGVLYKVRPVPADVASYMMGRLSRKLLPGVAVAIRAPEAQELQALLAAFSNATDILQDGEIEYFTSHFARVTQLVLPDGREPFLKDVYKTHFAARMPQLLAWLAFCLEVNFGPFYDGLRALLLRLVIVNSGASPGASTSKSPATSTAASGASSPATS